MTVAAEPAKTEMGGAPEGLEEMFDCILSSTIVLPSPSGGGPAERLITISAYLIGFPLDGGGKGPDDGAQGELTEVVEFYMERAAGWALTIVPDGGSAIEVAGRPPADGDLSESHAAERAVPDPEFGVRHIRLVLYG